MKRLIVRKLISNGYKNSNILIVGIEKNSSVVLEEITKWSFLGYKIIGFLDDNKTGSYAGQPILGKLCDFHDIVHKYFIDEVIVTLPNKDLAVARLLETGKKSRIGMHVVPEFLEESTPIIKVSYIGVVPLFTYKENWRHPSESFLKRFCDVFISATLLILLLPLFGIISILIKLDSRGSIFFRQERVGQKGRRFFIYKFRSMVQNADKMKSLYLDKNEVEGGVIFKIKNDPRITSLGKFLRKYSLDELPQLYNVFKGDMSLVGPRPPLVSELLEYDSNHTNKLAVKPGMTGMSQIRGRSDLSFSHTIKWDLWYVNNWSILLDFQIMMQTLPIVFKGRGAY